MPQAKHPIDVIALLKAAYAEASKTNDVYDNDFWYDELAKLENVIASMEVKYDRYLEGKGV